MPCSRAPGTAFRRRANATFVSSRAPLPVFGILKFGGRMKSNAAPGMNAEILPPVAVLPVAMIHKKTATITLAGIAVVALSSVLAYRLGVRHAAPVDTVRVPQGGCIQLRDAALHTGENTCVEGRVLRVFTSRSGATFLDFCQDYHHCPFGSVIFATDRSRFGNLGSLEGRKVEISGEITTYNGRAEIVIRDPKQIRVAQ